MSILAYNPKWNLLAVQPERLAFERFFLESTAVGTSTLRVHVTVYRNGDTIQALRVHYDCWQYAGNEEPTEVRFMRSVNVHPSYAQSLLLW